MLSKAVKAKRAADKSALIVSTGRFNADKTLVSKSCQFLSLFLKSFRGSDLQIMTVNWIVNEYGSTYTYRLLEVKPYVYWKPQTSILRNSKDPDEMTHKTEPCLRATKRHAKDNKSQTTSSLSLSLPRQYDCTTR